MNSFRIKNLSFKYNNGDKLILDNINIDINQGEFVCVLGQSGCGKSTLLRLLSGLEKPTCGEIFYNDKKIESTSLERSIVFQDYGLFPWMTAGDNISLAIKQKYPNLNSKEIKKIAIENLKKVGLDEKTYSTLPKFLSGGMKQRCAIAQVLSVDATCYLMDEPFGALDAVTRSTLQDLVLDIWQADENKKTIIFITHDVDEAIYLADRIIVLGQYPSGVLYDKKIKKENIVRDEIHDDINIKNYRNEIINVIMNDIKNKKVS